MTQSGGALESEEVDFLLKSDAAGSVASTSEVTMRGDLEQMNLADIFQTFAMSKMQGRLHVKCALDHRDIFFQDGFVRNLMPTRVETRRFGQALIQKGLITVEQMRSLLLEQKKKHQPLHRIVADSELVDDMQIQEIAIDLAAEDLYSLFTWPHGTFEFYKGPITDQVIQQRVELLHAYEVNGLLLEVARRSDEWQRIVETMHSPDEVLQQAEGIDSESLEPDLQAVFTAVDGTQSVRELGESSSYGLFDTARMLRELMVAGYLVHVEDEWLLQVAEQHVQRGDIKRAIQTLRTLLDRDPSNNFDLIRKVGALLHRCGESKQAARMALHWAGAAEDQTQALELARDARRYDGRSFDVLAFLRERLLDEPGAPADELRAVTDELIEAANDSGRTEDALAILSSLLESESDPTMMTRMALTLHRLGRSEDAVARLLEVAEIYKADHRFDRLAGAYEHILKIDYRRKDVARALKSLHAGRLARNLRKILMVAAGVVATGVGWLLWRDHSRTALIQELSVAVTELLADDKSEAAQALLQERAGFLAEDPGIDDLRMKIQQVEFRLKNERLRRLEEERKLRIAATIDSLDRGDVKSVLATIAALPPNNPERVALERTAKAKLDNILPKLESSARDLLFALPNPPTALQPEAARVQVLKDLDERFRTSDRVQVENFLLSSKDQDFISMLGEEDHGRLVQAATQLSTTFQKADELRQLYGEALSETELARRLDPIFMAARNHATRFEFEDALAAYRKLAAEYHRDDEMRVHIRDQVERHATILRHLETLRRATLAGDFATAQSQFRTLRRTFGDVPFDRLVALPLRVDTTPAGAMVKVNGRPAGRAPLLASYVPANETLVQVELEGFVPEETKITGDEISTVRSLLARTTTWQWTAEGAIERSVFALEDRILAVDRSGAISCLQQDGTLRWRVQTGDLSGLLPAPVAAAGLVVVASLDGRLRALRVEDGKEAWGRDGLPAEADPALGQNQVVVGTTDGHVVAVEVQTGTERWRVAVGGAIRSGLVVTDQIVLAASIRGEVFALRASSGEQIWRARVGRSIVGRPAVATGHVFVATEDGMVAALRLTDGATRWSRNGLGEITRGLATSDRRLFVAAEHQVLALALEDGKTLFTGKADAPVSGDLRVDGDLLWVPCRTGIIQALQVTDLKPRFLLRGTRRASAPPLLVGDGVAVVGFEDRTLKAFLIR